MMYGHNFRVGDRVVAVEAVDGKRELIGKSGTVIYLMGSSTVSVEFDEPIRAISPGQSLVLYDGDYVVGGGIIRE